MVCLAATGRCGVPRETTERCGVPRETTERCGVPRGGNGEMRCAEPTGRCGDGMPRGGNG